MTFRRSRLSFPNWAIISSVSPSLKNSCSGSPLKFSKGRIARTVFLVESIGTLGGRRHAQTANKATTEASANEATAGIQNDLRGIGIAFPGAVSACAVFSDW
jgi:hypothetical protein